MEILGESFKDAEGDENKSDKVADTRTRLEKKKVSNHLKKIKQSKKIHV